jgi:hypothetical protein
LLFNDKVQNRDCEEEIRWIKIPYYHKWYGICCFFNNCKKIL